MKKNLVVLSGKEFRSGTWDMSIGFQVEHRALRRLVEKYKSEFEQLGLITTRLQKGKGRPVDEFMLNERQALYLGTLLNNNEIVRKFKNTLCDEFVTARETLLSLAVQRQNAEWLENRGAGKETRCIATGTIKDFIQYAKSQGSANADRYYANITKMENQALFLLEQKYPNLRDALNIHQLSTIKSADQIVIKALRDGMDKGMHYRDIYKLAKTRIESFAEIIGKTLIPMVQLVTGNMKRAINSKAE